MVGSPLMVRYLLEPGEQVARALVAVTVRLKVAEELQGEDER